MTMTNSEILDRAEQIRSAAVPDAPQVISAEDSNILHKADMITNERRAGGISGLIETAIAAVRGERVAAERALQRAKDREAEIEVLLQKQATIERAVQAERNAVKTIGNLIAEYDQRTSPRAEAEAMASRWNFRHEPRFAEHLQHAVANIGSHRLIKDALPLYLAKSNGELDRLEAEAKAIRRQIEKLK